MGEELIDDLTQMLRQRREIIKARIDEISVESSDHFEMYSLMGMSESEAIKMEFEHRKQRILSSNLGSLVQGMIKRCMCSLENCVPNYKIKNFIVDFLINKQAVEVKLRETTTDGDHIAKEKQKVLLCLEKRLQPIRLVMYDGQTSVVDKYRKFYPSGCVLVGKPAWDFVRVKTGVNLRKFIQESQVFEQKVA